MTRQTVTVLVVLVLAGVVLAQSMMSSQGFGFGMMGGMNGPGMMGVYEAEAHPLSLAEAEARFARVARRFGGDVRVQDVMVFSNNFYAQLVDAQGRGIAEVLVDRYTGAVMPEPGPNMVWNTRSGMMGFAFSGPPRLDEAAAQARAETFLTEYLPGANILASQTFSGYTTFDFGREGVEGMLSINLANGEVWVHTWHGPALGGHD